MPPSLAMRFGGASSLYRRAMVHQCRIGQAVAFLAGDEPLALAMLDTRRSRRAELAIRFRPAARQHMRALIREAQLTLPAFVQARILVFARISPRNPRGQRMARIAGFRPGGFSDPAIWLWKGSGNDRNLWRRGFQAASGASAKRTAGRE
ncbi:hypothetical protein [Nitratireductor rhodophyticola]|uniref:hypothetical protein n=1 Tax=Nitratireductor rhodophyticola TaxID=2854036 RepID=UPI00300901A7